MNHHRPWLAPCAAALVGATFFSSPAASARPPRAERAANRIAERRYARLSIAEARAAQAQARAAEIAPLVPVPPPPRPATVRRMARAGVPLIVVPPPMVAPATQPSPGMVADQRARPAAPISAAVPAKPAVPATPVEDGAWTLDPDEGVAPAAAEGTADGTRSVLAAGGAQAAGAATSPPAAAGQGPASVGPPVTQPPIELLPTPAAKERPIGGG